MLPTPEGLNQDSELEENKGGLVIFICLLRVLDASYFPQFSREIHRFKSQLSMHAQVREKDGRSCDHLLHCNPFPHRIDSKIIELITSL